MASDLQAMERENNISSILRAIRTNKKTTRRELMSALELSWGCISELIGMLIEDGVIIEKKAEASASKGRTPTVLMLSDEKKALGVDVNKVGISFCVCDFYGEKLLEHTEPLNFEDREAVLSSIFSVIERARNAFPDISVIGIAMQGIKDRELNIWRFPSKKASEIDFTKDIESKLDLPTIIEHDPNCMLFDCIEDSRTENKMLVRIDGGIGAAIYKFNRFFDDGLLELGYTVFGENGERLADVIKKCDVDGCESPCAENLDRAGKLLGIALGNFCNLISLDQIVLCGDFMKHGQSVVPILEKNYSDTVIDIARAEITTKIIKNASFGAAKLAIEKFPYVRRTKI